MHRYCARFALTVAVGTLTAATAAAETNHAYIVTGADEPPRAQPDEPRVQRQRLDDREAIHIIRRPVHDPAATVSRPLRQQPVFPDLIELEVGGQTVLIDPHRDHSKPRGGIDENHHINKARRQADVPRPLPRARVFHGAEAKPQQDQAPPEPAAIIPVPQPQQELPPQPTAPGEPEPDFDSPGQLPRKMVQSR